MTTVVKNNSINVHSRGVLETTQVLTPTENATSERLYITSEAEYTPDESMSTSNHLFEMSALAEAFFSDMTAPDVYFESEKGETISVVLCDYKPFTATVGVASSDPFIRPGSDIGTSVYNAADDAWSRVQPSYVQGSLGTGAALTSMPFTATVPRDPMVMAVEGGKPLRINVPTSLKPYCSIWHNGNSPNIFTDRIKFTKCWGYIDITPSNTGETSTRTLDDGTVETYSVISTIIRVLSVAVKVATLLTEALAVRVGTQKTGSHSLRLERFNKKVSLLKAKKTHAVKRLKKPANKKTKRPKRS